MNKTLAPFLSVIVAVGVSATATSAGAQIRYLVPERIHPLPPPIAPGFRQTPMYAPDAPPPRNYNNPGIPDFQNGSRG
jgi:hypothetical protein